MRSNIPAPPSTAPPADHRLVFLLNVAQRRLQRYVAAHGGDRGVTAAHSGLLFVLGPCATVSQAMIDEICDTPDKNQLLHVGGGHAVIYGPDGSSLAEKLPQDQEGILYANIDLGMIGVAKNAADPAGHYSRPDVTRLLLNTKPSRRVEYFSLPIDTEAAEGAPAA